MVARYSQGYFELSEEQVEELRHNHSSALVESKDAVVALEARHDGTDILHWSANTPVGLVLALAELKQRMLHADSIQWKITLINDAGFVPNLLELGFCVSAHYLDHWLNGLADYQPVHKGKPFIRQAHESDVAQLARLSSACTLAPGWFASSAEWYREWIDTPHSIILAAEHEGSLSGLCAVKLYGEDNDKLWVRELAVHPNHRRRGVGGGLLDFALTWGQQNGAKRAFLAVDSRSSGAIALYRRVGFTPNGEEEFNLLLES